MAKQDDWITTGEAAELSGYHPVSLRRLLLAGKVKGKKFGEVWQVSKQSLLVYLREVEEIGEKRGPKKVVDTH